MEDDIVLMKHMVDGLMALDPIRRRAAITWIGLFVRGHADAAPDAKSEFAIKWTTKGVGEIAQLAEALLQMLELWRCPIDDPGCPDCYKVRAIRKSIGLPEERY
jgi:hypothetical protein